MAAIVDNEPKIFGNQTIISKIPRLAKIENIAHTKKPAVLPWHGMSKAYLHRFHLSEEAKCTCGNEYQTMDHNLFQCAKTSAQLEVLKHQIATWPASKEDFITKHKKEFCAFIESIEFDNLKI